MRVDVRGHLSCCWAIKGSGCVYTDNGAGSSEPNFPTTGIVKRSRLRFRRHRLGSNDEYCAEHNRRCSPVRRANWSCGTRMSWLPHSRSVRPTPGMRPPNFTRPILREAASAVRIGECTGSDPILPWADTPGLSAEQIRGWTRLLMLFTRREVNTHRSGTRRDVNPDFFDGALPMSAIQCESGTREVTPSGRSRTLAPRR